MHTLIIVQILFTLQVSNNKHLLFIDSLVLPSVLGSLEKLVPGIMILARVCSSFKFN